MATSSAQRSAQSRKLLHLIMQRATKIKQEALAEAIGRDTSTVCRILANESGIKIPDLYDFLNALGLKVVESDQHCVAVDRWNAMVVYARIGMEHEALVEPPRKLDWDEQ